eukprot:Amastigsp_a8263_3.p3 type:complete len:124 gc:universal Amastigsp_a8263_3:1049-678(-)
MAPPASRVITVNASVVLTTAAVEVSDADDIAETEGHAAERQSGGAEDQPRAVHVRFAAPTMPRPGPQVKDRMSGAAAERRELTTPPKGAERGWQFSFWYHAMVASICDAERTSASPSPSRSAA